MSRTPVHTAIDIGSTKVCAIIGRQGKDGAPEVLGAGVVPSGGLLRDTVIRIDELAEALASSVGEASRSAGIHPSPALLGISGTYLETVARLASVRKPESALPLSQADLEAALEAARPSPLPREKELLHLIAREYLLDGTRGIRNPVGMHALLLEVNAVAVLAASASLGNLTKAAAQAGIPIQRMVYQPMATSEAILSHEERQIGSLIVDIGGGTTTIALFWRGVFWDSHTIPLGGSHLTSDIAVVLGSPLQGAEEAKMAWGAAQPWKITSSETVQISSFQEEGQQEVPRKNIARIIHDRATELLEFIQQKLHAMDLDRPPAAGVVLTGGTASLPGLQDLFRDTLGCPVRIGIPTAVVGGESLQSPAFASSIGLFLWGLRHIPSREHSGNGRSEAVALRRPAPPLSRFGRWLPFLS